ncbi:hypothetical protein ACJX0J_031848, partial [Zea mays]
MASVGLMLLKLFNDSMSIIPKTHPHITQQGLLVQRGINSSISSTTFHVFTLIELLQQNYHYMFDPLIYTVTQAFKTLLDAIKQPIFLIDASKKQIILKLVSETFHFICMMQNVEYFLMYIGTREDTSFNFQFYLTFVERSGEVYVRYNFHESRSI